MSGSFFSYYLVISFRIERHEKWVIVRDEVCWIRVGNFFYSIMENRWQLFGVPMDGQDGKIFSRVYNALEVRFDNIASQILTLGVLHYVNLI